ncbi:hypothetical protein [Halosaccharopolyspora lacisalsi]|uniref:hypothetical protein n=1 Tax=Halosaccharopolyspora lacisalsi TaxID=1000566 RepID=UPI0015F7DB01|nr:hypothetical protein [Halosaccharopolyspora lacisalsi]
MIIAPPGDEPVPLSTPEHRVISWGPPPHADHGTSTLDQPAHHGEQAPNSPR